jgi:hypothetical protein
MAFPISLPSINAERAGHAERSCRYVERRTSGIPLAKKEILKMVMSKAALALAVVAGLGLNALCLRDGSMTPGVPLASAKADCIHGGCGAMSSELQFVGCGFPHVLWGAGYEEAFTDRGLVPFMLFVKPVNEPVPCTCSGTWTPYEIGCDGGG